jgi:hypothetical protein
VDPNAWAVGPLPVSHFLVKAAARRLLLLRLRATDADFSVADGHRPRLWPEPDGSKGLLWLEHRWQVSYTDKCGSLRARAGLARRRVTAAVGPQPQAAVAGRVHPLARAAAGLARRGQLTEGFADAVDALLICALDGRSQRPAWLVQAGQPAGDANSGVLLSCGLCWHPAA